MKKLFSIAVFAVAFVLVAQSAFGHSGRTDKRGCHHDRKRGGYHCH